MVGAGSPNTLQNAIEVQCSQAQHGQHYSVLTQARHSFEQNGIVARLLIPSFQIAVE